MKKSVLGWLLFFVIMAIVLSFRDRTLVSGQAPTISAKVFNQNQMFIAETKGPRLIYFWASWCGICTSIQGAVDTILQQYPGITVAMKSGDEQMIKRYLAAKQLQWPFVVDQQGLISQEFGVPGVPAIFILDKNDVIRFTSVGYSSIWGLRLRLWLAGFE